MLNKLVTLQTELKAPKSQYNSFGKYKYRNQEDILEAVKPLLHKHGLLLSISDEIKELGGELFVNATATITDGENSYSVSAQAGIDINKKGMDKSQTFGAASSYARKYALNGLFLIDDTKDADFAPQSKPELKENTEAYVNVVAALKGGKFTLEDVEKKYSVSKNLKVAIAKAIAQ